MRNSQSDLFNHSPALTQNDYYSAIKGISLIEGGLMRSVITANGQTDLRVTHQHDIADFYRNLNKPGYFSCKQRTGQYKGKVTGYANLFVVKDPLFTVSSATRQRILTSQKRSVHAYVRAPLIDAFNGELCIQQLPTHRVITYQPFVRGDFFDRHTGETVAAHKGLAILAEANVYCLS